MSKYSELIRNPNPEFYESYEKGTLLNFKRMTHAEAIDYCNENGILNEKGEKFTPGEDISEAPERRMVEMLNCPVLLTKFPTSLKPFYMKQVEGFPEVTESVDLLLPGVGEVLGGSMREPDYETLSRRFEEHGLDKENYTWYLDLRKYGHAATGGYGLGVDRYLCWILGQDNIRKVVLYPRYHKQCYP